MRGLPTYKLPDIGTCMEANLAAGRLTNPNVKFAGISINTANMNAAAADRYLKETADKFGLPAVDPFRTGVGAIVDRLA
jgi:uncharacterized NAD-dependent epimerase/dehydratase family protein